MDSRALSWINGALFHLVCAAILAFLLMPTVLVVPMSLGDDQYLRFPPTSFSLRWYIEYFSDPSWQEATRFSLMNAALTMICCVVAGTMAAVALTRGRIPGAEAIRTLVLVPLIIPHIVFAIAIYLHFAPLHLVGSIFGFVLAHSALCVPFVVIIVSAALHRVDPSLEIAALNLGASRVRVFLEVTMPLIRPALVAGALFAFLGSFDETIVSFFMSGVENKTVTRKLFEDIDFNLSPVIAAVSTIFVVVTVGLASCANLLKRRMDAKPPVQG